MKIFKYELKMVLDQTVILPYGATILKIDFQGNKPYLWAMVDPEQKVTARLDIGVVGTGHEIPKMIHNKFTHFETCLVNGFVWHFFLSKLDMKDSFKLPDRVQMEEE